MRVRIKMCGMTQAEDLAYAAALGVDAIGLILAPQSPRYISISQAKTLLYNLPPFLDVVAVLVNPSSLLVKEIIHELPIGFLQFHGEETAKFCSQFKKPYIKAVQVDSETAIYNCAKEHQHAAAILLDTPSATSHGGTGKSFDWGLIPKQLDKPIILAGGLNTSNIKEAVQQCSPYAVDLCSGVELSPGIKDHKKMQQFIDLLWGRE